MSFRCGEETLRTYLHILSVVFDLDCYLQASALSNEPYLHAVRLGSQLLTVLSLARLEGFHGCFHKFQLTEGVFRQMEAKPNPEISNLPLVVR